MIDPDYGTDWKSGQPEWSPERRLKQMQELHAGNISADDVEVIFRMIGGHRFTFTPEQNRGARDLAHAYGLDPAKLSWVEIAALWEGGTKELELARLQRHLDRRDMLERAFR